MRVKKSLPKDVKICLPRREKTPYHVVAKSSYRAQMFARSRCNAFIEDANKKCRDGILHEWKRKIRRRAALVLIEVADTGHFEWKPFISRKVCFKEETLEDLRQQYSAFLRTQNLENKTISLYDYSFRNKPRVHDFRHSYCVYRLNQWVRENADLNALYPYLSEFVGHSNFADTDYYLTLAEPFYPDFEARMRAVNTAILPEVPHAD